MKNNGYQKFLKLDKVCLERNNGQECRVLGVIKIRCRFDFTVIVLALAVF
jgi:hypothetical protein